MQYIRDREKRSYIKILYAGLASNVILIFKANRKISGLGRVAGNYLSHTTWFYDVQPYTGSYHPGNVCILTTVKFIDKLRMESQSQKRQMNQMPQIGILQLHPLLPREPIFSATSQIFSLGQSRNTNQKLSFSYEIGTPKYF